MHNYLKLTLILSGICVVAMVLFNHLALKNQLAKDEYLHYAQYAFESLKILFGMVIGMIASTAHHSKEFKIYKESIKSSNKPQ